MWHALVNHEYVLNKEKNNELRALSYLHSQGLSPVSLEVIEKTAFTNVVRDFSLTGNNEALFKIYDLIE